MRIFKNLFMACLCCVLCVNVSAKGARMHAVAGEARRHAAVLSDSTFTSLDWEYEEIVTDSTGKYYLYNLAAHLFLNDDNTLGTSATTLWTVDGNSIASQNGKYLSVTSQNEGNLFQPKWVFTGSSDAQKAATSIVESKDSAYYVIGNNVNISTLQRQARYLAADSTVLSVTPGKDITEQAKWIFISTEQYERKTADIDTDAWERAQAIEALANAISAAEKLQGEIEEAPRASKTALQTAIAAAKVLKSTLDKGGLVAKLVSTQRIKDAAKSLQDTVDGMQGISDYYVGAMEEIDNAEQISSATAMKAIITAARSGVELSTGVTGMKTVLSTMHYAIVGYLQTVDSLQQNQNLTGMIMNHSFDRGTMDGWTGMDIDLQKIDITKISMDNLGSLAQAIKIGMREGTVAMANNGEQPMQDVHGKFYLNSDNEGTLAGQPIAQPILGLPAGSYELSARMAVNPGLLHTNSCHLAVMTIPSDLIKEFLGNIDLSNPDLGSIADSIDIASLLPILLEQGQLVTGKGNAKDINTLCDVTLSFDIQKNDIVMIVLNGGLYPLLATSAYKADNLQLTYLHAPVVDNDNDDDNKGEGDGDGDGDGDGNDDDKGEGDGNDKGEGEGDADGISTLSTSTHANAAYDLDGRIRTTLKKGGITIRGGKKYLKK